VLDQLSDTETVQRPKSADKPGIARSADVEETVRHLPQTDLEAYANGRLPSARLDFCRTHLETCDACRAELEDVRTYQTSFSSIQRSDASQRVPDRRKRRRSSPALPLLAAATVVVVAGVSTVVWWHHKGPWTNRTPPVASNPTPPMTTPPVVSAQTPPTTPPADVRPAASDGIQHGKLPPPPSAVNRPRERAASTAQATFALSGPIGKTTLETRPEFTWQALPGAIGYTVEIVDTGLHPVLHSPGLRGTNWRPKHPLRPGETYFWQVTATLHGGAKVAASQPSLSETALKIAVPKLTDDMERFKQGHLDAHLVLAAMYAQSGMHNESAEELKKVAPGDPGYNMARAMLKTLPAIEPPATAPQSPHP
jgi:hypothetical protein